MRRLLSTALLLAGVFVSASAFINIRDERVSNANAIEEYRMIRSEYIKSETRMHESETKYVSPDKYETIHTPNLSQNKINEPVLVLETHPDNSIEPLHGIPLAQSSDSQAELKKINPDYIGWIKVGETSIDYPVALGKDNEKYLKKTFLGSYSNSGCIFMDVNCVRGFGAPVCILYGHNMRDGTMFAPLLGFTDVKYAARNREIYVADHLGNEFMYRVTDILITDAYDEIYNMEYTDGPEDEAGRFLFLSTCHDRNDKDARLIVIANLCE